MKPPIKIWQRMVFLECHQSAYWLSTVFPEFRYLNAERLPWWSNSVITCQNMNSWGLPNSFITRKHCGCSCNPYHSLWGLVLCDIINPSLVTDALYHRYVLNQPSLVSSDLWWWSLNIPGVFVHEDIYLPCYLLFMPNLSYLLNSAHFLTLHNQHCSKYLYNT